MIERRIILAGAILAMMLAGLIAGCLSSNSGEGGSSSIPGLSSYKTVTEVVSNLDKFEGKRVQIAGKIEQGTLNWDPGTQTLTFVLTDGQNEMKVIYKGPLPSNIQEGRKVVAIGVVESKDLIRADNILVACPSKYEEANFTEINKERGLA